MVVNFTRILVPVAGTEADEEALKLACSLTVKGKAQIKVIYAIVLNRSLPIDAEVESEIKRGEDILDRMERIAEEEEREIETDLLQARDVGPIVIDEASEFKAELIVMGVKYKQRLGQFSLGSVVPYVLKNARCKVLLYQQ